MRDEAPKPEGPFHLDMDFGEALARFAQTKPEEVMPAPGQTKKAARPTKGSGGRPLSAEDGVSALVFDTSEGIGKDS
jgi:hypothetical protein